MTAPRKGPMRPSTPIYLLCLTAAWAALCLAAEQDFVPVTDSVLEQPDDADWPSFRRTSNAWGFSPLSQISKENVGNLALVWTRPMGAGIQEATPLVYRGIMYLPNPGDLTQAIDAASGELRWQYQRQEPEDLAEYLDFTSI